jgi:hypothetical protein
MYKIVTQLYFFYQIGYLNLFCYYVAINLSIYFNQVILLNF